MDTKETFRIPADNFIVSVGGICNLQVGYKSKRIFNQVPFDAKQSLIPNERGKVMEGVYVSGWLKRGPTGVIATTMHDAYETAEVILQDIQNNQLKLDVSQQTPKQDFMAILKQRNIKFVDLKGWIKIDETEIRQGQAKGKDREKVSCLADLLRIAECD